MNTFLHKTRGIFGDFVSLFYPKICLSCGESLHKHEETICTICLFKLPKTNFHEYQNNPLEQMLWGRFPFENAAALYYFSKGGSIQHLIHQLKYNGHKEIGVYLGKLLGNDLKQAARFANIELIVPVPLHPKRQYKRGYNQSEQIAIGLSETLEIPIDNSSFIRAFATKTQTRKTRDERWQNVRENFCSIAPEKFRGKHLLLVDDVITTGATIESCAETLFQIADVKISIVTLAFSAK